MISARAVKVAIAFVILVILHYTLRPLLAWRGSVDFLIIALLLVAVRVRPGVAALVGLLLGLVADSLVLSAFGSSALAMCAIGFAAAWLKAVFFADNLVLNAVFFFLGKLAFDVVYLFTEGRVGGGDLLTELLVWSPIRAAVTAAAGLLMLALLRPLLEPADAA
jgi:rod shape-determining protein MreD